MDVITFHKGNYWVIEIAQWARIYASHIGGLSLVSSDSWSFERYEGHPTSTDLEGVLGTASCQFQIKAHNQ